MAARPILAGLLAATIVGPAAAAEPLGLGGQGEHQTCPPGQTSKRVCTRWVKVSYGHRSRCAHFADRCERKH